jgi:hypothetical protein
MGGYGSTRWNGHVKKTAVEECLVIDISELTREGVFREGVAWGEKWWKNRWTGEKNASVSFGVKVTGPTSGSLQLTYVLDGESVRDRIALTTTCPYFGGLRYWFSCPSCSRRIRKIYLPPKAKYFKWWQRHRRLAQTMGIRVRQVRWYERMQRNVRSLVRRKTRDEVSKISY